MKTTTKIVHPDGTTIVVETTGGEPAAAGATS